MNPDPSPPSGGKPLAPRHRPNLDDLNRDTTEQDLWDLDDSYEKPASQPQAQPRATLPPPPEPPTYRRPPAPPTTAESDEAPPSPTAPAEAPDKTVILPRIPSGPALRGGQSGIQLGLRGRRPDTPPTQVPHGKPSSTEEEFEALDDWEQFPPLSQTLPGPEESQPASEPTSAAAAPETTVPRESPASATSTRAPEPESPAPDAEIAVASQEDSPERPPQTPENPPETRSGLNDEFSPPLANAAATPLSLRPKLRLSITERIGMLALILLLLSGAVTFLILTLQRLPKEDYTRFNIQYPVKGKLVSLQSSSTYWRAPLSTGDQVDTFRRGTALLPVIELEASADDALIRVFFYDGEGQPVGDAVTRPVRGKTRINLAATAGFDDPGLHAAYRTGLSPLWNIILYEGPPGATSASEFKKFLEIPISSELR